ncbi:MAG: hypothetical protein Q7K26_05340 [bacterium]|nr:hypothetical protein [bacterium]
MDTYIQGSVCNSTKVREAILYNRSRTQDVLKNSQYYRLDRSRASDYLWCDDGAWKTAIQTFFQSLRQHGERVVYVDVCGRANASSLGADRNYSFSLQPTDYHFLRCKENLCVQGDIFNARDFYSFVNLLRKNKDYPAFVTFVPVAGLQRYTPWHKAECLHAEVIYQRLENNLRKMLEVVRPGGFIFVGRAFQFTELGDFFRRKPLEKYESSLWIRDFCRKNKCTVKICDPMFGPSFLIRKRINRIISRP